MLSLSNVAASQRRSQRVHLWLSLLVSDKYGDDTGSASGP
jgi:hypothetical protein